MIKLAQVKKIGKTTLNFQIEGENLFDVLMKSKHLGFTNIDHCGICKKDNLYMDAYLAQEEYEYVKVICKDCKASLTFGKQKKTGHMYPRRIKDSYEYDWQERTDKPKADKEDTEIPF